MGIAKDRYECLSSSTGASTPCEYTLQLSRPECQLSLLTYSSLDAPTAATVRNEGCCAQGCRGYGAVSSGTVVRLVSLEPLVQVLSSGSFPWSLWFRHFCRRSHVRVARYRSHLGGLCGFRVSGIARDLDHSWLKIYASKRVVTLLFCARGASLPS